MNFRARCDNAGSPESHQSESGYQVERNRGDFQFDKSSEAVQKLRPDAQLSLRSRWRLPFTSSKSHPCHGF